MSESMHRGLTPPVWPGELAKMAELPDLADIVTRSDHGLGAPDVVVEAAEGDGSPAKAFGENCGQESKDSWNNLFAGYEPTLRILDGPCTEQMYARRRVPNGLFEERRLDALMQTLRSRGEYRKLAVVGANWRAQLDDLEANFPNFAEVIDYFRVMYVLAECGTGCIQLDPILLNGPPGCGKSYFAECIGRCIGAGFVCLHMETAQSNSALAGSSDYWSNSKPGEIFNALVERDYANIVVFADEIEKTPVGQQDPLLAMLSLLEPGTARHYVDQSLPFVTLDASHLIFICASNDADALPEYLASRLRRFDLNLPTLQQGRKMVRRIHARLGAELPSAAMSLRLTAKTIDTLAALSPRLMKKTMREGIGRALYKGRDRVLPQDLRIEQAPIPCSRGIGFL